MAGRGKGWEEALKKQHDTYRRLRQAYIVQTPPPFKMVERVGGKVIGFFEANGPPDFMGVANGVSFVFDAKETSTRRWPFSKLELHQAQDLEAALIHGAQAFLAIRFPGRKGMVLPWLAVQADWWGWRQGTSKRGFGSIQDDDPRLKAFPGADWLSVFVPASARDPRLTKAHL